MKRADGFVQAYNAQAVVDAESQVIVAQGLSDRPPGDAAVRRRGLPALKATWRSWPSASCAPMLRPARSDTIEPKSKVAADR